MKAGTRVRVTFDATTLYDEQGDPTVVELESGCKVELSDGMAVVELPPAEPRRRGALIDVENSASVIGILYVRPYSDDGSDPEPWRSAISGEEWHSWATIVDDALSVRVLFEGVEES